MIIRVRRSIAVLAVPTLAVLALPQCTVFNGLSADARDGGSPTEGGAEGSGLLPWDSALRLCALVTACPDAKIALPGTLGMAPSTTNYSLCVSALTDPQPASRPGLEKRLTALTACAGASSCELPPECAAVLPLPDAQSCPQGTTECSVDRAGAFLCDSRLELRCGAGPWAGASCRANLSWPCMNDEVCSADECRGDTALRCQSSRSTLHACDLIGTRCGTSTGGGATCLSAGAERTCTTAGERHCSGDVLEVCTGLFVSPFDCQEVGLTCREGGGEAACIARDGGCSTLDPSATSCVSASAIQLCVRGQLSTRACPAPARCEGAAGGKSARCAL